MVDWLIIGGGVHGSVISHALLSRAQVSLDNLRILDPHARPMAVWLERTRNCGMQYLRSPAAHATVPDFTALLAWGRHQGYDRRTHTIPPYARPSLELFNAHARAMVESSGIRDGWIQGTALALDRDKAGWAVRTDAGTIRSRRVVLAPGQSDGPRRPDWAEPDDDQLVHVFDHDFDPSTALAAHEPVVIGGGVSAVHLALFFARNGRAVRLLTRHAVRVHQFDSDPCYIGPRCMRDYLAIGDPELRRSILDRVRNPGSIPPDLDAELGSAVADGSIVVVHDEIVGARRNASARTTLMGRNASYETDLGILATGLAQGPPAPALIGPLAGRRSLPVDSAGYPVPGPTLQWDDGLYVTGALGEQELGPSARNIIGAHNAAKRIIADLSGTPRSIPSAWPRYGGYSAFSGSASSSSASSASADSA